MPFTETRHGTEAKERVITKRQWEHIYERWIKRAVESYKAEKIVCKRSPGRPGSFVKGIVDDLANADLVIADLTGGRPNVYYELGIRHALKTGSIIITQHLSALPSDLAGYFAFEYHYDEKDFEYEANFRAFEEKMHRTLGEIAEGTDPSDSPVSDFLGLRHQLLQRTAEAEKIELVWLLQNMKIALERNYDVCADIHQAITSDKEMDYQHIPLIDVFPLEVLYSRIFSVVWTIMEPATINALAGMLTIERQKLMMLQQFFSRAMLSQSSKDKTPDPTGALFYAVVEERKDFEQAWNDIMLSIPEPKLVWKSGKAKKKR